MTKIAIYIEIGYGESCGESCPFNKDHTTCSLFNEELEQRDYGNGIFNERCYPCRIWFDTES